MKLQLLFDRSSVGKRLTIYAALILLVFAGLQVRAQTPYSHFVNPLFIPDTLSSWPPDAHNTLHLDVMEDSRVLFPNASPSNPAVPGFPYNPADNMPIGTIAYSSPGLNNPGILGPTLIWWYGDSVTMEVQNHLHHETTTHWHGAHVAPQNDGGPHQVIDSMSTWKPSFQVRDDVSTLWYHPHLHHHTQQQVQRGMAGMIIVKNTNDPIAAQLPHDYGVNDFPIVVQDKFVQYDSILNRDTINYSCSMGTIALVNGTWKPMVNVPDEGWVRFRVLNGSSERSIALSLQRGADPNDLVPFYVIASDAGYINEPYSMNTAEVHTGSLDSVLMIMGGERYEIVFNTTGFNGDSLFLVNRRDWMKGNELITTFAGGPSYDNPGCYTAMLPDMSFDSIPMPLLKILPVSMPNAPIVQNIPATLANWEIPDPASVSNFRTKYLLLFNTDPHSPPFSIDGVNFDLEVVNDFIELGATEIWDVYNPSGVAHPFHVHDIHFFITEIEYYDAAGNGTPISVPPYMRGPKDVMPVTSVFTGNGLTFPMLRYRLIGTWEDFAVSPNAPNIYENGYMYHCHILAHEDGGMMHQFVVINTSVDTEEASDGPGWLVFPNPTTGNLTMEAEYGQDCSLQLLSPSGALLRNWSLESLNGRVDIDLGAQPAGMYLLRWLRPDGVSTRRVMVVTR